MRKIVSVILLLCLICSLAAGCRKPGNSDSNIGTSGGSNDSGTGSSADAATVDFSQTDEDMFSGRDVKDQYDIENCVQISLSGASATASSDSVKISGSTVTLTQEATYILSGTLDDGMIVVDADDTAKLQLIFNGISVTGKSSAAFYILEADKVFVTLAEGTLNTLSNGGTFTSIDGNNIDGAVFSKQDLTFNGAGALTVTSPAGHGIVCKDDLVFTGGSYTVNTASHGLDVNDSVRITGATQLTVDAGKDGIHCENSDDTALGFVYISNGTLHIEAEGDGISSGSYMQIEGGSFDLLTGGGSKNGTKASSDNFGGFMGGGKPGGRPGGMGGGMDGGFSSGSTSSTEDSTSMKGLKSGGSMLISGGTFHIDSADDTVHSDASLTINGGTLEALSGDDGIHAEETLTVTAGTIRITESYEGLEALHILLQGGDIQLSASDDGLNAAGGTDASGVSGGRDGMFGRPGGGMGGMASSNGSIVISGGKLYVKASGDGIDANGTLTISGGYTVVVGPTQGDTATLDYDKSAVISGGTFIGTGASGMAQTFSECQQGVIAVSVGNQNAGTNITLTDKAGNTILSYAPELPFAVVILSSPQLISGETYSIAVGEASGDFEAR